MAKSLKANYLLNVVNTVAGMVFPLITFPYASRILEADGIGIVNFYQSIVSYISLVTCLGIPLYAVREIAKVKDNPEELSKRSTEILFLHIVLTLIGYGIVAVLCFTVPQIKEDIPLFLVMSAILLFNAMGCEWFFRGTEDFKFVTIRGFICRIIYIPLLFIFVKTRDDLLVYGILTVGVQVGNNVFNIYRLSRLVRLRDLKEASRYPMRHLKGAFSIFLLSASSSLYLQVSVIILGFLASATAVGYYTAANKMIIVVSGFVVAMQTTMLPRMSHLISNDKAEEANKTLSRVLNFMIGLGLPICAGLIIMSPLIIKLFAGDSFFPSVLTLRILAVNMVIATFNGFMLVSIFVPQGKEKISTYACLIGGIVNIGLNFILIPLFEQNGTALAAILTELSVGFSMILLGRKYIPINLWDNSFIRYIIGTLVMAFVCVVLWNLDSHEAYRLTVIPGAGIVVYIGLMFLFRDSMTMNLLSGVSRLIKTKLKPAS